MVEFAALITALAALIGAILWPSLILIFLIMYRRPIRAAFDQLPTMIHRAEKAKVGMFEFELRAQAEAAPAIADREQGRVSAEQITSAAKLEVFSQEVSFDYIRAHLERLAKEYDTLRAAMPAGTERTRAMNKIMAQMRVLGPSLSLLVNDLKSSGSAGERLAALAIMQMDTRKADLSWIADRFPKEAPFVFYQAALLLQTLAQARPEIQEAVQGVARSALKTLRSFPGTPDTNTIKVLEAVVKIH